MTAFSFSYAPKASTALASINPIQSRGEGLRFAANAPMSFTKQNPEIVTEGFWKGRQALTEGIVKGTTSALSGVTGALTQKAADAKAITDAEKAHDRAVEIARIKAAPTQNEEIYKSNQLAIQNEQLRKLQTENNNVDTPQDDSVAEGDTSVIDQLESLITPAVEKVNSAPPTQPAAAPAAAPPAAAAAPAPPAAAAPANVTSADPNTVFQTASTATPESTKNVLQGVLKEQVKANQNLETAVNNSRKKLYESANPSVAYEVKLLTETNNFPELEILAKNKFIDKNVLDEYKNIKSKQELITSRPQTTIPATPTANKSDVLQDLSFNDINITPSEQPQLLRGEGYQLPVVESEFPTTGLPESKGQLVLNGASLPLEQITGAEGNAPLAKVEPVLPTTVPSEPATATPELTPERTQEQIVNEYVGLLTNKPYRGAGDARRAKQVLEKLGLKAEIETEKGEKGSRLHYVKVVDEATSPMEKVPKGMVMKQVTDKDGVTTNVYVPAMPVEQQVQSVNVALDRAKTLKTAIKEIRGIIGGISPGVGGAANLMAKLPFPTDASTVESLNETIKGIIGFQELVDLKAAGGSLGALSDAELKMLTSLQGSLDVKNLHRDKYLAVLKNIEARASDVEKKMEAHKKDLMTVEKKTNFQPIQSPKSESPKKGDFFYNSKTNQTLMWDGNSYIPQ